jgi:hypothetical protein
MATSMNMRFEVSRNNFAGSWFDRLTMTWQSKSSHPVLVEGRKEPFAQGRFAFALQNRSSRPFFIAEGAYCRQRQLYSGLWLWANEFHVWQGGVWGVRGGAKTRR